MADELVRASGLWVRDGKQGKFFRGQTFATIPEDAKILIFKNDRKQAGSNEPDYTLFFASPEDQPPMRRAEPAAQESSGPGPEIDDESIPF